MKRPLKYLILTLIIFTSCKKKSELPILSYHLEKGEKIYYKIDDFNFINQDGISINSNNTIGQVHTINFFFTSCPSICPPMKIKQLELANYFENKKDFKQYSISIDLKRDNTQKISDYAKNSNIDSNNWNLLIAKNNTDLQKIAKEIKTNFKLNKDFTDFYHSSYLALLDKKQQIRGFYDILSDREFELLKNDIKDLLNE
jgi:protein SCO1